MIQNIRENVQGLAAKVIIVLIAIPFAAVGIDSFFSGGNDQPVATVNGERIESYDLERGIAIRRQQMAAMFGDNIDPQFLSEENLRGPVLNSLVEQELLRQEAKGMGVTISNAQLNQTIAAMAQFHEDGEFSQQRYEELLRRQGYNSATFKELLGSDLLLGQLREGIASTGFVVPTQTADRIRLGEQRRSFQYINLKTADFEKQVKLDEESISAYYEDQQQRFQRPEAVKLELIELKQAQFETELSEEALREAYDQELQSLEAEGIPVAHILIDSNEREASDVQARLAEVQAKLKAGEAFAALAESYSDDTVSAEQGGDLGVSDGQSFPEAFEEALQALAAGETSAPVETDAGLHLIRRLPSLPPFEEYRGEIASRLQAAAANKALLNSVEQLKDLVFNADGLAEPAAELGLSLTSTDWLERGSAEGLLAWAPVATTAFDDELRELGVNSDVLELSPEHFVVLRVKEYRAPEAKPLAEVREQIEQVLVREQSRELAAAQALSLQDKLKAGEDFAKMAKSAGYQIASADKVTRRDAGVSAQLAQAVFAMVPAVDGVSTELAPVADGVALVQLTEVLPGSADTLSDPRIAELEGELANAVSRQDYAAYFASLRQQAEVKTN